VKLFTEDNASEMFLSLQSTIGTLAVLY